MSRLQLCQALLTTLLKLAFNHCRALEIGSGSGYIICSLALLLQQQGAPGQLFATDVNLKAAAATRGTLRAHSVSSSFLECIAPSCHASSADL